MSEALRFADLVEHDPLTYSDEAAAELRRLSAELEKVSKDAERYRWLRDVASGDVWGRIGNVYAPDETDEAIDAAMKGTP